MVPGAGLCAAPLEGAADRKGPRSRSGVRTPGEASLLGWGEPSSWESPQGRPGLRRGLQTARVRGWSGTSRPSPLPSASRGAQRSVARSRPASERAGSGLGCPGAWAGSTGPCSEQSLCVCVGGDKCSLARGLLCGSRSSVTEGGLCPPVPTGSPWLSEEGCLLGSPVSGSSHPPRGGLSPQMPVCQAGGVHGAIWPWAPWEVVFLWETAEVGERWRWGRGPSARQPDKIETTK